MKHVVIAVLIASLALGGCATTGGSGSASPAVSGTQQVEEQHPMKQWMASQSRAKKKGFVGALVGAAAGAATAALTGRDPWEGAAVGAVTGAIAGFLVGRQQDVLFGSRDEAVRRLAYDPSQGYVMRVDEVAFAPANPAPGDEVVMTVRYLVVGPNPRETLTIESFTGIKYDEEYVMADGPSRFTIERGGGIVESTVTLKLPKNAPAGSYALEALLEDTSGRFEGDGSKPLYLG